MREIYLAFTGFVLLVFTTACQKKQEIPSYLFIPEIQTSGIYTISGTDSSKIYGAKVFLNNNLIGVYQTPVEIPVFAEGDQNIQVQALIEKDGFSDALIPYPFFEIALEDVFLTRDSTVDISPVVDYLPTTNVNYWFEDFDGQVMKFINTDNSTSELDITHLPEFVYEKSGSGLFKLNTPGAYIKALTDEDFFYKTASNAFVELNYKNNQPFFFALVVKLQTGQIKKMPFFQFKNTINSEGELYWNKIYFDIGSALNSVAQLQSFELCFEVTKDESITNPIVLIDNVKLIRTK